MTSWAVLVAAGRGERLGLDRPKAFAPLRGRALLAESLERLEGSERIDGIVVVAPEGWEEPAVLLAEELGCGKVAASVPGGATRADSVKLGVAEVPEDALVLLVHDAARPLLSDDVIERVLAPLSEGWDGVVPALPLPDTVKRVDDGAVVETLAREGLYAVQTPQAFVAAALREALVGDVSGAGDCASLLEARWRVKVVEGDPRLLKVTVTEDLALLDALLGEP
ncbi:MAG: 2-C-methyl-D-erythritol 4-phosphate cytidylyltransferase [Candidatus Rokuibacteriota bacterium]|nr:MAG: 2-C-methyl-D-erythritol 4-phosphate cytidylyltransferase [Candidatus Rokubacteria bacterium]